MEGRTTLVITHRLTGLERMDEILVLDRGQIVERGKHEELLQQKGFYYFRYLGRKQRKDVESTRIKEGIKKYESGGVLWN